MIAKALLIATFFVSSVCFAASDRQSGISNKQRAFEASLLESGQSPTSKTSKWHISQRLAEHKIPGASVAIIENNETSWVKGYGVKQDGKHDTIDENTVFSVGSVSKMINAALVLRLVAEKTLDLDTDINHYLTSWKVPNSRYNKAVTIRMLLSHTSGFSQHGFADFYPGEPLPSALQTLKGHYPAKHGPVRLLFTPGSNMKYSGGGTTITQVLIEDVTKLSYEEAAQKYVFQPLGMSRSTFQNPLPSIHGNIAKAHDRSGEPTALPRGYEAMPEMAASGLWTSATDLARFVIALNRSTQQSDGFLPQALALDMMTRVQNSWHGLGPRLNGKGQKSVFHHGGANNSYRAWIEGHFQHGTGIVILTNATNGHKLFKELRRSAQHTYDWPVDVDTDFPAPY